MIKQIIKTTDEINNILTLAGSFDIEDFRPSLRQGLRFASRYVGQKVIDICLAHYYSDDYSDILLTESKENFEIKDKLVKLVQQACVSWGFYKYAPIGNVIVNSSGIQVTWNERTRPANDWQLDRMADALRDLAFENIDELLKFLVANKDALEITDVKELKTTEGLFINNADEFNQYYDIDYSPRFFMELVPIIRDIELRFLLPILKDRFAMLKEAKISKDPLSELNASLLNAIYLPLAKMAIYEASTRLKREIFVDSLYIKVIGTTERTNSSPASLYDQAEAGFKALEKLIKDLDAPAAPSVRKEICSHRKGFRL